MYQSTFQIRLKQLREEFGYSSQNSFAKEIGVAQSTVGGWESGAREPSFATLKELSNFFGVSTDYLLGENCMKESVSIKSPLFVYLGRSKQAKLSALFDNALELQGVSSAFAVARSGAQYNFFPRLQRGALSVAPLRDIMSVAHYLRISKTVSSVLAEADDYDAMPLDKKEVLFDVANQVYGHRVPIKIAGRDGTLVEKDLTDADAELLLKMIERLPDAGEDL